MYFAACFAANRDWHFGKRVENDRVGVQPGGNRLACLRTPSEDSRHASSLLKQGGEILKGKIAVWLSASFLRRAVFIALWTSGIEAIGNASCFHIPTITAITTSNVAVIRQ